MKNVVKPDGAITLKRTTPMMMMMRMTKQKKNLAKMIQKKTVTAKEKEAKHG